MTRTQIQFPDPLYKRLKKTAASRDWSLAELLRRAAEAYLLTIDEGEGSSSEEWQMPVLRPSGGYIEDPARIHAESAAVAEKLQNLESR
ncbi:MAG: CopG family transcriptional regulator [Verrucomicrobiota bacterium]